MNDFEVSGGCQCGAVRYSVSEPARETQHCHCGMCRKIHGALFATFSVVSKENFTVAAGRENLATFDSSARVHRNFCKRCGSHLFNVEDDTPDVVYFTPGTLDDGAHPGHRPETEYHIWVGSKVPWYEITDGLPQHEEG